MTEIAGLAGEKRRRYYPSDRLFLKFTSTTSRGYSKDTNSSDMCMDTSYRQGSGNRNIGKDDRSCLDNCNRKTDRPTSSSILVYRKIHS